MENSYNKINNENIMRDIVTTLFLIILATAANAQVAIGKASVSNSSVSLEFGDGNKGLLLPWVNSAAAVTGAVDGTIIFDTTDKKVKYRRNNSWFDLSKDNTGVVDTTLQNSLTENPNAKAAIGANGATDNTPGILVLTDTNKAMILPKVSLPQNNIINPAPGMMVYDPTAKQLAVYNGSVWSFWMPEN